MYHYWSMETTHPLCPNVQRWTSFN